MHKALTAVVAIANDATADANGYGTVNENIATLTKAADIMADLTYSGAAELIWEAVAELSANKDRASEARETAIAARNAVKSLAKALGQPVPDMPNLIGAKGEPANNDGPKRFRGYTFTHEGEQVGTNAAEVANWVGGITATDVRDAMLASVGDERPDTFDFYVTDVEGVTFTVVASK